MKKNDKIWIKMMEFGTRMGCHQMPSRSFFFKGYQFPVCARCTGVIIGEFITIVLLLLSIKMNSILCVFLLSMMGIDWIIQYKKILESNNKRRLISGILGGIGLTYIYYYIILFIIETILLIKF